MCDLGLGPLTSFIIYSSRKSRRALVFDYTVIGILQLAAFIYGLYAVANIRPGYIVSVGDRLEVVSAGEIDDADLAQGADRLSQATEVGTAAGRQSGSRRIRRNARRCCFPSLQGKDYGVLPAYYVPYEQTPAGDQAAMRCR